MEDEEETLILTVEQLVETIKTTWIAKSIGYDYEHRVDFEEEVEADSEAAAIELMIDKFIDKNQSYAEEVFLEKRHILQVPLMDTEGIWWFKEFTHTEEMGSLSKNDIKNYPLWKNKVIRAAEEKAAAEKAKKEVENKQWREDNRRRELEIYNRLKRELEASEASLANGVSNGNA